MATPDLTRLLTGFQGALILSPTNLALPAPYGGTQLGEVMDIVAMPRRRTRELHGEEFGPDEPIEVADAGEGWKITAALRGVDPDLYALVMAVPATTGVPSGRPLYSYPAAATQAGAFLTQRSNLPAKILLVPKDTTRLPSFMLYAVVPVLDASARLTLQLDREGTFGAVFYLLRNSSSHVVQVGQLEDLALT